MPTVLLPILIFLIGFPIMAFGIFKLVITLVNLGLDWGRVEARFPNRPDEVLAVYELQSAIMGAGVQLTNCLTITACRTGMRVEMWRLFGRRSGPFFVPWRDLRVTRARMLLEAIAVVELGSPPVNTMKISGTLADKLAALVPDQWPERIPPRTAPPIVS
jgi:hypothetical protein